MSWTSLLIRKQTPPFDEGSQNQPTVTCANVNQLQNVYLSLTCTKSTSKLLVLILKVQSIMCLSHLLSWSSKLFLYIMLPFGKMGVLCGWPLLKLGEGRGLNECVWAELVYPGNSWVPIWWSNCWKDGCAPCIS